MAIDILAAMQNKPEPLNFVLPGLVRGTVGAIVSPGGAGKSAFALQLTMCGYFSYVGFWFHCSPNPDYMVGSSRWKAVAKPLKQRLSDRELSITKWIQRYRPNDNKLST